MPVSKQQNKRLKQAISKELAKKQEEHYFDHTESFAAPGDFVAGDWTFYPLLTSDVGGTGNGIEVGSNYNQRNGNKIRIKEIQVNIDVFPHNAGGTPTVGNEDGMICRFVLMKDKNWRKSTTPSRANYMSSSSHTSLTNHWNRNEYHIYKDFSHCMTVTAFNGTVTAGGPHQLYQIVIKPNTIVEYEAKATSLGGNTDHQQQLLSHDCS